MDPPSTDVLLIRKTLQDALADSFGLTFAGTRLDVLFVSTPGSDVVVRVHPEDASRVLAAVVGASRASIRYSAVRTSSFLPSLVHDDLALANPLQ